MAAAPEGGIVSTPNHSPAVVARISDLTGLVALIPSLLGFQPERSIAIVFVANNKIALTMRCDLADARRPELVQTVLMAADRADASELAIVGYVPKPSSVLAELLRDLAIAIEHRSMDLSRRLSVTQLAMVGDEHWCEVPTWTGLAAEERPVAELESHPLVVAHIHDGRAIESSRADLAKRIEFAGNPPEGFAEGHAEAAAHIRGLAGQERAALVAAMLDDVEMRDAGSYPAGETLGWLVAAIRDGEARDEATLRIHAGSARRWFEFWSHVSRFTDGEQAVVPLALSALAAWVHGDGATALIATERAAAIEPDHLLVRLVQTCVQQCLPPQVWERFLAAFPNASVLIEQNENGEVAS